MEIPKSKFQSVREYEMSFPAAVRSRLTSIRKTILENAPAAEPVISYNMPAFKLNGVLVWYAAYNSHIGFYPKPSAIQAFKKQLSKYKSAKGSVQFPLDEPLPLDLIGSITRFRAKENLAKSGLRYR